MLRKVAPRDFIGTGIATHNRFNPLRDSSPASSIRSRSDSFKRPRIEIDSDMERESSSLAQETTFVAETVSNFCETDQVILAVLKSNIDKVQVASIRSCLVWRRKAGRPSLLLLYTPSVML